MRCGVVHHHFKPERRTNGCVARVLDWIGCMAISFFGTVASVLGFFVEVENFEEVEQIVLVWAPAFPVFAFICGIPQFMLGDAAHAFGTGGWLSTYLAVQSAGAQHWDLHWCYGRGPPRVLPRVVRPMWPASWPGCA